MFLVFCVTFIATCNSIDDEPEEVPKNYEISFTWFEGSLVPDYEALKAGLNWTVSTLGAVLPANGIDNGILSVDNDKKIMRFDFSKVGFRPKPLEKLHVVLSRLKASGIYKELGHVELGRLIVLTLNSTYHYYEITEVPETLSEFKNRYPFPGPMILVVNSIVANTDRRIEVAKASNFEEIAYLSEEGEYDTLAGTFEVAEFEAKDLMPSGQFRFALYDKDGFLKKGADPITTAAGKPAKCLWCHETYIQPFFTPNPVLEKDEFLTQEEFISLNDTYTDMMLKQREGLAYPLFDSLHHHTWMEKIYQDFMEPSLEQIALEWRMSVEDAFKLVGHLPTHTQHEYGVENLYYRKDVDPLSPYGIVQVPDSDRELSDYEPNFF